MIASAPSAKWYWEKTDPSRSGSSGDLSKLFKNENVKQPGVFSAGAPSADATVLVREVIQNSWDAAIELREDSDDPPPFEICFAFKSARSEQQAHLTARLGLDDSPSGSMVPTVNNSVCIRPTAWSNFLRLACSRIS